MQWLSGTIREGVSVIVSRPNDGSILALANYPTFDLNEFSIPNYIQ